MKLQGKSRILLIVAVIFGTAIAGLSALLWSMRQEEIRRAETDGANLAWMLEARLDATLRRVDADLVQLARALPVAELRQERVAVMGKPVRELLQDDLRKFDEISGIYYFDAQGMMLYASRDIKPFSIADRSHFLRLRDDLQAGLVFGDSQVARSTGTLSMVAARGIRDGQGRFAGMVATVIDLEYLYQLLASINIGPQGVIAIRRSDDSRLVLRRPHMPEQINKPANYAIRDRVMAGERTGVEHLNSPTDGAPRMSTFRALPNYPFYVVIAASLDDVLASWRREALLIGSVATAFLLALSWLGWRLKRGETHALSIAARLEDSEERLRYALAATGDGIWDWDVANNRVSHNEQWGRMLGLDHVPAAHPVELFAGLLHPDDCQEVMARIQAALDGQDDYVSEHRMRLHDGREIWVLDRGKVVERDAAGKPLRMVGSMSDITARRLAEAQQRESEVLLRSSIDALDEAFVIFDADDRLVYCNDKYRQVYPSIAEMLQPGTRFEDILRTWKQRLPMGLPPQEIDDWVAGRMAAHRNGQILVQHTDNDRWIRIVERRAPSGHIVGFRVDVTELYQAKEAAEAASVSKSRFLATMSHEIRTPMNGILGMAQLLLQPEVTEAERYEYARTIYGSGKTLLTLLNDILDLSKVEAGKLQLESGVIDPHALTRETRALFAESAAHKQLALSVDVKVPPGNRYQGDGHRVRQMLSNLLNNAIKFTSSGSVEIAVREVGRDQPAGSRDAPAILEFSVRDTGIGIPADIIPNLFQPFSQADSSTTRQFGGSGLGLSIVRNLAELMGGEVGVESVPGQGSRFWFRIRVAPIAMGIDTRGDQRGNRQDNDQNSGQLRGKVLVVEDNRTNRIVIEKLLVKLGLEVLLAEDGVQGVAAVQGDDAIDLVLMDMQMPELDGESATREIRTWEAASRRAHLPIIALTANAYESDRQHCLDAGMDDFLAKPVALDDLMAMLGKWLPQSRQA